MPRGRGTEDFLDDLSLLRHQLPAPQARAELRNYLTNKSNLVVAKAARLAGEFELQDLAPQLVEAFHRFMRDPAKADKRCAAKTEIVRALEALRAGSAEVYLSGIRHIQMEGSFGPPVDTAAGLRAACAMGLVHMLHPDAILEIVTLLADRESDARIGAVRALAYSGRPEAVPLLRLKMLSAETSTEVIAECFTALVALSPEKSLDFVGGYLDSGNASIAEAAALALGQSRQPAAIALLKSRWSAGAAEPLRRALLVGLALAREEEAFAFLFSLVETAPERIAAEAVVALAMYRHEERVRNRVASLVQSRQGAHLRRTLKVEFGPPQA